MDTLEGREWRGSWDNEWVTQEVKGLIRVKEDWCSRECHSRFVDTVQVCCVQLCNFMIPVHSVVVHSILASNCHVRERWIVLQADKSLLT